MKKFVLILVAFCSSACVDTPPPPSDSTVLSLFEAHRGDLQTIVDLFERHSQLQIVAKRYAVPESSSTTGLPDSLIQEVRQRLIASDVGVGVFRRVHGLEFCVMASGLPSGGIEKGLLFSPTMDPKSEDSLDGLSWHSPTGRYYREIGEGWFLYFERDR